MANPENQFSGKLVKTFRSKGIFAHKAADRFKHGISDIYVKGGNWIECKQIEYLGQKQVALLPKIKETQIDFLMRAEIGGDQPYVSFQFTSRGKKTFFILQWFAFRHIVAYTPQMHELLAEPIGKMNDIVDESIDGFWRRIWSKNYHDWFSKGWVTEHDPCARYFAMANKVDEVG